VSLGESDLSSSTADGKVLPCDNEEGDDGEKGGEDDGDEFLVKDVRDAEAAAAPSTGEINKDEGNRYPPVREAYPRTKDSFL